MSTIAVVVDMYNSLDFLPLTLSSVSAQSRAPDEVVIVDDNSSDGSREFAMAWAARQAFPVRLLHNSHGPSGSATLPLSLGLAAVTADYVATLDGDDAFLSAHLETLASLLDRRPEAVLAFGNADLFRTDPAQTHGTFLQWEWLGATGAVEFAPGAHVASAPDALRALLRGCFIPSCAYMFRRQTAIAAGGIDLDVGHAWDYSLYLKLAELGAIAWSRDVLALRRVHENAVTAAPNVSASWPTLLVLAKLWSQRETRQLDREHTGALATRLRHVTAQILYTAACNGPRSLFRTWRAVGRPAFPVRYLARSAASVLAAPAPAMSAPPYLASLSALGR